MTRQNKTRRDKTTQRETRRDMTRKKTKKRRNASTNEEKNRNANTTAQNMSKHNPQTHKTNRTTTQFTTQFEEHAVQVQSCLTEHRYCGGSYRKWTSVLNKMHQLIWDCRLAAQARVPWVDGLQSAATLTIHTTTSHKTRNMHAGRSKSGQPARSGPKKGR